MKILVVCNGGMSSSILTKKIKEAADKRGMEVTVAANSTSEINDQIGKWDVCLVAPQIMYAVQNVKNTLNIPVESIDFRIYAVADGDKVLDQAIQILKKQKKYV